MTKLVVTGGAGFIGSNLVRQGLERAAVEEITVLDDLSTGSTSNLEGLGVRLVEGSLLDESALDRALAGADAVVHLAALPSVPRSIADPVASHAANASGTLLLLEACRRNDVGYVCAASSSAVYGANQVAPQHERQWVRPLTPYAVSKLATEQYLLAYQSSFGLQTLPFRLFNVFGPGQPADHAYAAVIPAFVSALLAGEPVRVDGDGLQTRDFTYVGTVCDILLDAACGRVVSTEPVNLAFGSRTTLLELLDALIAVTGIPARVEHLPPREGDIRHSQADNGVLRDLFPHVSAVGLHEGLRETVDWFRSRSRTAP